MSLENTDPSEFMVTDQKQFQEVCKELQAAGTFGFDTEFIRERSYEPQLCLVQAATPNMAALIDPFEVDVTEFWELVADKSIRKIVHAGSQDLEMCYLHINRPGANIFDVQIAAGLVGLGYPMSYGKLVHGLLGKKILQDKSYSEWSRRPLSPGQLNYATEDVLYLDEIYTKLTKRLRKLGRTKWLREEMGSLESSETFDCNPRERWRKVQGWQRLTRRKLGILRELAAWREEGARRYDVPPRTFLKDQVLTSLARQMPNGMKALRSTKGFPRPLAEDEGRTVLDLIDIGRNLPEVDLPDPVHPKDDSPVDKMLQDLVSATGQSICLAEDLCHSLFASRSHYAALVSGVRYGIPKPSTLKLLTGWRKKFAGDQLNEMLVGERTITVANKSGLDLD
ncbi:MAG: ribonuclease D [Phycisphaerales bacterium]|nr:ribonuclease D [Phycisphaerales bacterium]